MSDWFPSTLHFSLISLSAFHQMAISELQNQERVPESLNKQLALAVRSIQWTYAIFWTISDTQPGYSKFLLLSVLAYFCSASLLFSSTNTYIFSLNKDQNEQRPGFFVLICAKMMFCSVLCSFLAIGSA